MLALRFLDRVGKGVRTAPRDALLAESIEPERRGEAFGFHRSADNAGSFAGIAITTAVVFSLQRESARLTEPTYRSLVALAIVPAVLAVASIAFFVREPDHEAAPSSSKGARAPLPRALWPFFIALFVFRLSAFSDNMLVQRAKEIGLALPWTFVLLGIAAFTSSVASWPTGKLSDRIGRRGLLFVGWTLYAAELVGFAFPLRSWQLAGLFALHGIYLGLTEGVASALLADLAPREVRGTAFGLFHGVMGVAALPASAALGFVWSAKNAETAFVAAACCAGVGAGLLAFVRPARATSADV